MSDVVMMHVYLVGDPTKEAMDFTGLNAGYSHFSHQNPTQQTGREAPFRWPLQRPEFSWRSRSSRCGPGSSNEAGKNKTPGRRPS